jgi:beta-galactosidase
MADATAAVPAAQVDVAGNVEGNRAQAAPPASGESAARGFDIALRSRLLVDSDWRFHFGHLHDAARDFGFGTFQRTFAKSGAYTALAAQLDFQDGEWDRINLPHDWAVSLPFAPAAAPPPGEEDLKAAHGYKPLGREFPETSVGWYRRTFTIPATDLGRRLHFQFDGVFRDCIVFCNGHIVGGSESGYAPFHVDVTDFVNYGGPNVLAVRVDASLGEGWFYEGAGIYRHVWLEKTAPLHVAPDGVFVRVEVKGAVAEVRVSTEVVNESDADRRVQAFSAIYDPRGKLVTTFASAETTLAAGETCTIDQHANVERAELWSLEQPRLYRFVTTLRGDGPDIDSVETSFGIRSIEFDAARGFLLNGVSVKLKGTCNHQDHAGVGAAVPDRLLEWRIEQLLAMGSNAYRSAHNPPARELLEICDRRGMLVIDETRIMSSDPSALSQLTSLVRRDRNHPSVVLWSLGNEEPQQSTERGARIVRTMKRTVHALDPTRPTIFAMDKDWGSGVGTVVDVVGFNYRTPQMGDFHDKFPEKPILGTETGSTVGTRGIYRRDDAKGYVRAYDVDFPWWASTAESWWDFVERRQYIAGGFVWTGFDYRGEPTPFNRWPSVSSHFGILDTCGFPKDNFYYYQARWSAQPVLHLFPHWNWAAGDEVDVWCHSNLERVELFLNGVSQGVREVPRNGHVAWKVRYAPGLIEARGYRGKKVVLTSRRETAGSPARLVVRPDRMELRADGEDLAVVAVQVVDARGRVVPHADNEVRFALSGPGAIIGVGNGNPVSLEADRSDRRRAFNGLCMAIVQTSRNAGVIDLQASSDGLPSARVTIRALESTPRASLPAVSAASDKGAS